MGGATGQEAQPVTPFHALWAGETQGCALAVRTERGVKDPVSSGVGVQSDNV